MRLHSHKQFPEYPVYCIQCDKQTISRFSRNGIIPYKKKLIYFVDILVLSIIGLLTDTLLTTPWFVIMCAIASQITSLAIVYTIVYSDTDQRKHQSSASLAFAWGIHRGLVNSPQKWPVTRKMFPFDDVIMLMRGKCVRIWCTFEWEIHQSPVDSPHKGPKIWTLGDSIVAR